MEQRKVMLTDGRVQIAPSSATVGLVVSALAIEVTTVLTFKHIPWYMPLYLHFPVNTANGRLEQCAVLHNNAMWLPSVSFNSQTQTIVIGPCLPEHSSLLFSLVIVYVPSFKQSFIGHLHMGSRACPCPTILYIRNMLPTPITAQVRAFNGSVLRICQTDALDTDWLEARVVLNEVSNCKVHVFLSDEQVFGIEQACCVRGGTGVWALSNRTDYMPDPHLWVLKPPMRDLHYARFYVSEVTAPLPNAATMEPQELIAAGAKIVCNRDVFFEGVTCTTVHSDLYSRVSMANKLFSLDLHDEEMLRPWLDVAGMSWRTDVHVTPLLASMLRSLGLE
jgi:hypothetical protein